MTGQSRLLGRRRRGDSPAGVRRDRGGGGLVVGLHGYGSDERQLDTLLPLDLPVVVVQPRGPHRVDPGWGWWLPEAPSPGRVSELAPLGAVDEAVEQVVDRIERAQRHEGFGPSRTVLSGYSQGAMLALSVAARRPDLMAAVVTGAGSLLRSEIVRPGHRPLRLLVMNGTLDPVVSADDHADTLRRFERIGHVVRGRYDAVPHVIDASQVPHVERFVASALGLADPKPER